MIKNLNIKYKIIIIITILLIVSLSIILIIKNNLKIDNTFNPKYKYYSSIYPSDVYNTKVYTKIVPIKENERPGKKRIIKYIVIHETGNYSVGANSYNHAMYLSYTNKSYTSWHYTVDDTEIYHHIPDNEVAYHAGDKIGNLNGIGIELCVNKDGNFDDTLENGAKLVAYLLKAYNLDLDAIKTHHDFNGKDCPHEILKNNRLEEFKKLVNYYLMTK